LTQKFYSEACYELVVTILAT